jgi:hypothetical protein
MAKNSVINLDVTPNSDGFSIAGGTTSRQFSITGAAVSFTATTMTVGSNVVTLPSSTATLATRSGSITQNGFIYGTTSNAIASTAAATNGQILIGSTSSTPVAATITGTSNQVVVTNGTGTITLSLPQSIATTSDVTFGQITSTGTIRQFSTSSAATLLDFNLGLGTTYNSTLTIRHGRETDSGSGTLFSVWFKGDGSTTAAMTLNHKTGVLSSVTWNGVTIGPDYGGTGQSSYTTGDILYASGSTALSKLNGVATGNVLISGGTSTAPSWGKVTSSHVNSTVIVAAGTNSFSADQSMGTFKLTNVGTPSASTDAANKAYVDSVATGLDFKASVKCATTANITLSGTQTIDGYAVQVGDRVLVKDQSTGSQNGIYVAASSTWSRATDADDNAEVTSGMFVFVEQGTANGDTGWVLSTDTSITVGTTALTFTQFTGTGLITAGAGLTKTGNQLDVVGTTDRITVNADSIDIASTYVGQATITTLGTVTTGTWSATTIAVNKGGTGKTSITSGKILWASATNTYGELGTGNSLAITSSTLDTIQDITTTATPVFASLLLSGITSNAASVQLLAGGQSSTSVISSCGAGTTLFSNNSGGDLAIRNETGKILIGIGTGSTASQLIISKASTTLYIDKPSSGTTRISLDVAVPTGGSTNLAARFNGPVEMGGDLTLSGSDLVADGNVTAAQFIGSGALLTDISGGGAKTVFIPGIPAETSTGVPNVAFYVGGTVTFKRIWVFAADNASATDSFTVKVTTLTDSTAIVEDTDGVIASFIASGDNKSVKSCTWTVTGPTWVNVYATSSNGHQNITVGLEVE